MAHTPEVVDFAIRRAQRTRARAARQEGRGDTLVLQFGDARIAELGPEFPLDVLEPLQHVNVDLALLVREAINLVNASEDAQTGQVAVLAAIVDILAINPNLPGEVVSAVKEMGKRLLGEDGYAEFIKTRPSPWDVSDLVSTLFTWYGLSLGESSRSTTSAPNGGPTSNSTSSSTSASMQDVHLPDPDLSASSESAA